MERLRYQQMELLLTILLAQHRDNIYAFDKNKW